MVCHGTHASFALMPSGTHVLEAAQRTCGEVSHTAIALLLGHVWGVEPICLSQLDTSRSLRGQAKWWMPAGPRQNQCIWWRMQRADLWIFPRGFLVLPIRGRRHPGYMKLASCLGHVDWRERSLMGKTQLSLNSSTEPLGVDKPANHDRLPDCFMPPVLLMW